MVKDLKMVSRFIMVICLCSIKYVRSSDCPFPESNSTTVVQNVGKLYKVKIEKSGIVVRRQNSPAKTTRMDSKILTEKNIKPGEVLNYKGMYDIDKTARNLKMFVTIDEKVVIAYPQVEKMSRDNNTTCLTYEGKVSSEPIKLVISKEERRNSSVNIVENISREYVLTIVPSSTSISSAYTQSACTTLSSIMTLLAAIMVVAPTA